MPYIDEEGSLHVIARLYGGRTMPLVFDYDPHDDPFVIFVESEKSENLRWELGRDVLSGLMVKMQTEHVVRSYGGTTMLTRLGDQTIIAHKPAPDIDAHTVWVPTWHLAQWLTATYNIVPQGTEYQYIDFAGLLEELLTAEEATD